MTQAAPSAVASSPGARRDYGELLRRFGLWLVLVLVVIAFSASSSTFRSQLNLENIMEQNAIIGIVACGMAIMMIAGGFDLSVGATGATVSVAAAAVSAKYDQWLGIVVGLAIGVLIGVVNGIFVSRVKVNAFITTFAMASVISGLLFVSTSAESKTGNAPLLVDIAANRWFSVPIVFIVFVVCLAAVWFFLTRTRYGHYVYSVGGNAEASHLSGVPVQRIQTLAFVLGGFFAGLGGLMLLGQTTIGQPSAATTWPLQAIAICVVAGIALAGGIGRATDVLAATLLLGVIANGLNQLNISPYWQPVVTGVVILTAVALDRLNRARATSVRQAAGAAGDAAPVAAGVPEPAPTN